MESLVQLDEKLIAKLVGNRRDYVARVTLVCNEMPAAANDFDKRYCNATTCAILSKTPMGLIGAPLFKSPYIDKVSPAQILKQFMKAWNHTIVSTDHNAGFDRHFHVQRSEVSDCTLILTCHRTNEVEAEQAIERHAAQLPLMLNSSSRHAA